MAVHRRPCRTSTTSNPENMARLRQKFLLSEQTPQRHHRTATHQENKKPTLLEPLGTNFGKWCRRYQAESAQI